MKKTILIVLFGGLALLTARAETLYTIEHTQYTGVLQTHLVAFDITSNGGLKQIGNPLPIVNNPSSMVVDKVGRSIYVVNRDKNTITGYHIGSNGTLTPFAGNAVQTPLPTSVAVDSFGRFVYVTNADGIGNPGFPNTPPGHVSTYRIGFKGALMSVGSPVVAGQRPDYVVADPSGRFVYVANDGGSPVITETVSGYSVAGNGTLIPLKGSPFPEGGEPLSLCIDPLGRFLYTTDWYYGWLTEYRIANNGTLSRPPNDYQTGISPNGPAVADPFGRFVYVNNTNYNYNGQPTTFSGFHVANNGALTPAVGSPFTYTDLGGNADLTSMVVDMTGQFLYIASSANCGDCLDQDGVISVYRIGGNGSLMENKGAFYTGAISFMAIGL